MASLFDLFADYRTSRALVLVVALLPFVCAAILPLFGRPARRVALWLALLHLLLTAGLTGVGILAISQRGDRDGGFTETPPIRFQPEFVPGDVGGKDTSRYRTSWTLMSLSASPTPRGTPGPDVQFFIGVDGFNVWLVALASLMMIPAILVSWESVKERPGAFYGWLFLLQGGAIGAFLSFDVLLFYVFFELTLIPAFFLIGRWGVGSGRRDAARKFFLYTLAGSLLTLVGIVGVVISNPVPLNPQTGVPVATPIVMLRVVDSEVIGGSRPDYVLAKQGPITFSLPDLMANVHAWAEAEPMARESLASAEEWLRVARIMPQANVEEQRKAILGAEKLVAATKKTLAEVEALRDRAAAIQVWLFVALIAGFLVKVPVWPFHTWLPAAYGESPIGVTILLSALLAKLGTFGILRLVLPLTPDAAILYGLPVVGTLAAFGIVYAAFCAYDQKDIKLLIAYSSVSHLGFLVLAIFAFNTEGLSGSVLHMVNHGLSTGAMFAMLAFLLDRYRTTQTSQFGGLMGRFPNFAVIAFALALASIGLPGFNNFVSEMLMLAGLFDARNPSVHRLGLAVVATFGILLSAWYVMTMLQKVFFNAQKEPEAVLPETPPADVNTRECFAFGTLAGLCLLLGLFPQVVLDPIRGDARKLATIGEYARARVTGVKLPEPPPPPMPDRGAKGGGPKGGPGGGFPKGGPGAKGNPTDKMKTE